MDVEPSMITRLAAAVAGTARPSMRVSETTRVRNARTCCSFALDVALRELDRVARSLRKRDRAHDRGRPCRWCVVLVNAIAFRHRPCEGDARRTRRPACLPRDRVPCLYERA